MLLFMLATFRFAVCANIANDRGEFRDMRGIGRRHLPQRSTRRDSVLDRFGARRQLLFTLTEQNQTMRDTRFTGVDAPRGVSDEITIFTHRRMIVMLVFGRSWRNVGSQRRARSRDPRHRNHFEKLASIHGDLPGLGLER
jgi:hypothetical protein